MKKKSIFFITITMAIAFAATVWSYACYDQKRNDNLLSLTLTSEVDNQSCRDLSSDGPVQVSGFLQSPDVFYVPSLVKTNQQKITVVNRSGADVVVHLFSESDTSEPIRYMTVEDGGKGSFTGLTSRFLYMVGIISDVPAQLDVMITD